MLLLGRVHAGQRILSIGMPRQKAAHMEDNGGLLGHARTGQGMDSFEHAC